MYIYTVRYRSTHEPGEDEVQQHGSTRLHVTTATQTQQERDTHTHTLPLSTSINSSRTDKKIQIKTPAADLTLPTLKKNKGYIKVVIPKVWVAGDLIWVAKKIFSTTFSFQE